LEPQVSVYNLLILLSNLWHHLRKYLYVFVSFSVFCLLASLSAIARWGNATALEAKRAQNPVVSILSYHSIIFAVGWLIEECGIQRVLDA